MVLLLPLPTKAQEDPLNIVIEEQLSELDLAGIRAFLADLEPEVRELLPPFDVRRIVRGEGFADLGEIMLALLRYLWGESLPANTTDGSIDSARRPLLLAAESPAGPSSRS